jgi:thiamine biosynthesis lipoprotein
MRATRFRAMGTDVELLLDAPPGPAADRALAAARAEIERLERALSRFSPESDLSRLNRERVAVAGDVLEDALRTALALRERTGGLFDPTVGRAVRGAGYDRSFERLVATAAPPAPARPGGGEVRLLSGGEVELGPDVDLDLGGVAKGIAADRAVAALARSGPGLANVGGDLSASGPRADGPWTIAVATGAGPLTLALEQGGLATSGRDRRRWRRGGRWQHHVIDPRTGVPARTDLVRATAVCWSAAEAEARATALLVAGSEAPALAEEWSLPAVLVPAEGPPVLSGGIRA